MAESSIMVSLPQMVDLALHSPEVGAVNFNILHSLLHVIIQQVDLSNCQVEFRGNDSERIQSVIHSTGPGPTLHLTEYTVTSGGQPGVDPGEDPGEKQTEGTPKKAKDKRTSGEATQTIKEELVEKEIRVIDQRKDSKEEPLVHPIPMVKLTSSSSTAQQTVVLVEPTQDGGHIRSARVSVALSKTHFNNMEEEIEKLKEEVRELKELPANMGLFEALRNAEVDKSSPVLDMFQILALVKRVEAAETGINKLASMVEDLAREKSGVNLLTVGERASELQVQMRDTSKLTVGTTAKEKIENLDQRVTALERTGGPIVTIDGDTTTVKELVTRVSKIALGDGEDSAAVRIVGLENKFTEYAEHMATMDTVFTQQVNTLQSQFTDLEKEIGEIVERINSFTSTGGEAGLGADMGVDQEGVRDLYNKVLQMQEEMEKVSTTATKLMEDKEERQLHMDALLEQVELLKTIKADREDLQDALADKADTCAVNRKVSHAQFESACDDLSHSIEDALGKLTQQERLWQQALDDIQQEIGNKLDKLELTPLKEFVTNKLRILQDRLKALTALKQETEAAGTKSKFLRNVNCISCDKEVVMRKHYDPTTMPPPPALPPTKSMAPYLAYELDALRKQQKCAPHSRNMHHFENAMSGVKTGADDHICNRYCGGSHTVTTPQQRVTRLGHFLQQWGPETQPANEGQLRGTDGQWYKTREAGDETPKIEQTESAEMDAASYQASMKSRPSMMVQGGILSARFGKAGKEGEGDGGPRKSSAGSPRASKDTGKKQEDNASRMLTFKPGDVSGERE